MKPSERTVSWPPDGEVWARAGQAETVSSARATGSARTSRHARPELSLLGCVMNSPSPRARLRGSAASLPYCLPGAAPSIGAAPLAFGCPTCALASLAARLSGALGVGLRAGQILARAARRTARLGARLSPRLAARLGARLAARGNTRLGPR